MPALTPLHWPVYRLRLVSDLGADSRPSCRETRRLRMPEYVCVKCFSCGAFQSQQRNKAAKFSCPICSSKQAMLKVYAISDKAKDIRLRVQTLNAARLQQSELGEEEDCGEEDQARGPSQTSADHSNFQPAPNWANYLEDDGSGDTGRDPEVYTSCNGAGTVNAPAYNTTSRRLGDQDRYITTLDQAARGLGKGARKRNIPTAEGDSGHASLHRQRPSHHHDTLPQQKLHQKQYIQPISKQHTFPPFKVDPNTARASPSVHSVSLVPVQPATAVRQTGALAGSTPHSGGSRNVWDSAPQAGHADTTQHPHQFSSSLQQPQRNSCASQQHSFPHQQHSLQSQQQQQTCMQTSHARNFVTPSCSIDRTNSPQTNGQQQSPYDSQQAGNFPGSWQHSERTNPRNTSQFCGDHADQQTADQQAPKFESASKTQGKAKTTSSSVWDSFNEDDEADDGAGARVEGGLADDQSCQGGYAGGRLMTSFL